MSAFLKPLPTISGHVFPILERLPSVSIGGMHGPAVIKKRLKQMDLYPECAGMELPMVADGSDVLDDRPDPRYKYQRDRPELSDLTVEIPVPADGIVHVVLTINGRIPVRNNGQLFEVYLRAAVDPRPSVEGAIDLLVDWQGDTGVLIRHFRKPAGQGKRVRKPTSKPRPSRARKPNKAAGKAKTKPASANVPQACEPLRAFTASCVRTAAGELSEAVSGSLSLPSASLRATRERNIGGAPVQAPLDATVTGGPGRSNSESTLQPATDDDDESTPVAASGSGASGSVSGSKRPRRGVLVDPPSPLAKRARSDSSDSGLTSFSIDDGVTPRFTPQFLLCKPLLTFSDLSIS